jgi:hypothetical protein
MPAYPPNIIGGDYDRFPMMPGMPGTGGMMPGGGGGFFAGKHMLSMGTAFV